MSLNFPSPASTGSIYTVDNYSYRFDGVKWIPTNRTDYTVQASDITAVSNSLVIDMSKDGIQLINLSSQAVVSFTNTANLNEYKRVLLEFSTDPAYVDTTVSYYDIVNSTFETGKSKLVSAQDTSPAKIFFKPDGLKMYIFGFGTNTIYQYALSTAWDVSTAVFETGKTKLVTAQDTSPTGIFFKPDGLKMYIVGTTADTVYQYALNPAWDVSTATFETGKTRSVAAQDTVPYSVFFKPDGLKMYVNGSATNTIYQYALSTAWDVSTATFETGKTRNLPGSIPDTTTYDVFFRSDGLKMYTMGLSTDTVYQFGLATAWDVSTAYFETGKFKSLAAQDVNPYGIFFKPDGTKMYMMGLTNKTVYQYNTSITTQDTIANVTWPTIEWKDGYAPSLPNPQETALIEIEARTDYTGTNYTGRLVGRNF